MMKQLDPDRTSADSSHHSSYFRQLFEQLDRLSKLHLISCPDSPIQDNESLVDTRYEKLRAVFRQLSHGVGFHDPESIRNAQISRALKKWNGGDAAPESREFLIAPDPDVWHDRIRVEANYRIPGLAASLKSSSAKNTAAMHQICEQWRNDSGFSFKKTFEAELGGYPKSMLQGWSTYMGKFAAVQLGQAEIDDDICFPPASVHLITKMILDLEPRAAEPEARFKLIHAFFASEDFRTIPIVRITALFWATIARQVHAGMKPENYPKGGMYNDIDAVACYSPYCDAMFMDREIVNFATYPELKKELMGRAKLFSLREKDQFMEYLTNIEREAPPEHLALVEEVYGADWPTPFVELLSIVGKK